MNKIIEKIKEKKIRMKPRVYFILKAVFLAITGLVLSLFVFFLVSLIIFISKAGGLFVMPRFGIFGLRVFLVSFPWLLIISAVVLVVLLEIFAKRFSSVYRKPIIYSILIILIIVVIGGFAIEKTRMHQELFRRAQGGNLPVIGKLYRPGAVNPKDAYIGIIDRVTEEGFILEERQGNILEILIDPETRLEADIEEDEMVIVVGRNEDGAIRAIGVHETMYPLPSSPNLER